MAFSDKHVLAGKRIVISGAGVAGLIFARALDQNWPAQHPKPEIVIYERSARILPKSRDGYTIGIKVESGLLALHKVGLLQMAMDHSTTNVNLSSERMSPSFWTKHWKVLLQASIPKKLPEGVPSNTPWFIRLIRGDLRRILMSDMSSNINIHFENGCERVRILPNGSTEIDLSDGSTTSCDLLIAADGANSNVRSSLLPDQKLDFAGVVGFIGTSVFPTGKPQAIKNRWGMNISGQGVPFLVFPVDDTHTVWATSYRTKQPRKKIRGTEADAKRDEILGEVKQLGHMFKEPFRQIVDATEPETLSIFNAEHKYPIKHSEGVSHANVVFLGDANHPMSPFSGNGANMALLDGVSLAEKLIQNNTSVRDAINAFDEESMPRSAKAIDNSWWTIRILHSYGWSYWLLRSVIAFVSVILSLKNGAS